MLRSSGEIKLDSLVQAHLATDSSLHPLAASDEVDMGAFLYAASRVPAAIREARLVILGQSRGGVNETLGVDIGEWQPLGARARRRRWYWDGKERFVVLLSSPSDIDDLIPTLVAFQIEWNKLHRCLKGAALDFEASRRAAGASVDDWERLRRAWREEFQSGLKALQDRECRLSLRMSGGSHVGYAKQARAWWSPIGQALEEMGLSQAPVYFCSSNVHSLVNVLSGVAHRFQDQVVDFVGVEDPLLAEELHKLDTGASIANRDNWLYYAARVMFDRHPDRARLRARRAEMEREVGIRHLPAARQGVDSAAQIFRIDQLDAAAFDPRLGPVDEAVLRRSKAAIINIDYPLGLAAYHLLRQVAESVHWLLGVYVMGKAATLNAQVGDVLIPNVVLNEHSGNTYWLDNCFSAADVQPQLAFGSALDNQRAVTVRGTFLQNRDYLELYYQGHYTIVEMEAGPYLDASYEVTASHRHPSGEHVNMSRPGFDLGIIHYASDTPYTQARTLGARGLDYRGMDSTYAASVAVARRILRQEGAIRT